MTQLHPIVQQVTQRIAARSADLRAEYEADMHNARPDGPARARMSCSNLAHVFAASGDDKSELKSGGWPNVGIITAYNDMLSAHQPFGPYPDIIKNEARKARATAQIAGGVPAMCDGVTQGQTGMELSLFSRDVIALATAVSLSHEAFDATLLLGVCDKIVPGLFIGAARFGHLPVVFVPAGPMPSGIPNPEKAKVRKRYAAGQATRAELLEAEAASYHSAGTCTFYGTANSNQLVMEAMGLHVPGTAFVPPGTGLREALTRHAVRLAIGASQIGGQYRPFAEVVTVKSIVNGMVGLLASGGSTNHAIHLVAMARAAGVLIDWEDMSDLSGVTPLMARVYPNGVADVNHFHAAGGVGFLIRELLEAGLMHRDVATVAGTDLTAYTREPFMDGETLNWRDAPAVSGDLSVLRPASDPFENEGGLRRVKGNLGRAVVKTSAVQPDRRRLVAPARVFESQAALESAFKAGALDGIDFVAVMRFQGPRANGMPELHKLTPPLSVLQDRGQRVALVTDGRMSGASGAVLAAIHVTPEALSHGQAPAGPLARVREGDLIEIDAEAGKIIAHVGEEEWASREPASPPTGRTQGTGRELFELFRKLAGDAELGASPLFG